MKVTIINWEKFNPRADVKHPHWFRLSNTIHTSQDVFDLSFEERWAWISILCLASQRQSGELEIDPKWFTCHTQVTEAALVAALEKLARNGCVTYASRPRNARVTRTIRPRVTEDRTLQDTTEQEITEQNTTNIPPRKNAGGPATENPVWVTWESYSKAFEVAHGTAPPQNKKNFAHCKQLIDRVGRDDAPEVAAFFLTHHDRVYVQGKHPLALLVRDAEKLRTEWKTGKKSTHTSARDIELSQGNVDAVREYVARKNAGAV